jgi:hypothetical protein
MFQYEPIEKYIPLLTVRHIDIILAHAAYVARVDRKHETLKTIGDGSRALTGRSRVVAATDPSLSSEKVRCSGSETS